jgi:hypothetical protein
MSNGNDLKLLSGGHTYSVARLDLRDTHTISRELVHPRKVELADVIASERRKLSHNATSLFSRVKEKLPERDFTVNTGVMTAGNNRLYVCAVIERIK